MQGFARNCSARQRSHRDRTPTLPEHSRTQRCLTHHLVLRKERGSAAENSQPPDSRPERSSKHQERAIPWLVLWAGSRPRVARSSPSEYGLRSDVPAYPRIETKRRRGATPSRRQPFERANRERSESCQSQRRIATARPPDQPGSVLDFLPRPEPYSKPRVPAWSWATRRFRRGTQGHIHELCPTWQNGARRRLGRHAAPG